MPAASMKQLLESGVHFGHQTRRWNPKMKPYIFTERGGIHIIDLQQTTELLDKTYDFVRNIASRGGTVMFVGTKKQCQDVIRDEATRVGMPYVSHRWLGGLLTNFSTIERTDPAHARTAQVQGRGPAPAASHQRAHGYGTRTRETRDQPGRRGHDDPPSRCRVRGGPQAGSHRAPRKSTSLACPSSGWSIPTAIPTRSISSFPGNDDAIRSCSLIVKTLVRAVEEGRANFQVSDFLRQEAAREAAAAAAKGSDEGRERRPWGPRLPRPRSGSAGRPPQRRPEPSVRRWSVRRQPSVQQ